MRKQRGEAVMVVILVVTAVAGLVWSILAPSVGRYALASDPVGVVRMDTKTGAMERCRVLGEALQCKALETAQP